MPDTRSLCTTREAFPLIPDDALPGLLVGLAGNDPVDLLWAHPEAEGAFEGVADWILRHPARCLASSLPGLWLARDEPITSPELPIRVSATLARCSIAVWGDILEFTPSHLIDIRGFGEGCLRQLVAAAVRTATAACRFQPPPRRVPTVDAFESRHFAPRLTFRVSEFRRLADWAANEAGATTVADLLAACTGDRIPDDIEQIRVALYRTQLTDLFPGVTRSEPFESLVTDLFGVLDSRTRLIFQGRISLNALRTLDDLASELGITRERVRQLSVRAEERVRDALRYARFAPVGWRAHTLSAALGAAVPPGPILDKAVEGLIDGVSDAGRERVMDFLFWLAGPYSWDSATGWLRAAEVPAPTLSAACSDERGLVYLELLRMRLAEGGLIPEAQTAWVEQIGRVKCVQGNWLIWEGSLTDKAERILEVWGKPATPDEIVDAVGEGHDLRASRNRLFEDERFMRVDMNRIGLRSWGLEEYSSIAEQIAQEIERQGGIANLTDIISSLGERFSIRESSIRFFVNAPMFILRGDRLRLRTPADPFAPVGPVTEVAGCYLIAPDVLVWRMDVTGDTIRGSGRVMPPQVAAWVGVSPGGRRSFAGPGVPVAFSWPETSSAGPTLGSVRSLVERVGAAAGDQVLLILRRDKGSVEMTRIEPGTLLAAQGLGRLALLTGIPNQDGEAAFLHTLGAAIGTRGTRAAVSAELRRRGEPALAALVPAESVSPDLDAAIDALRDLF